MTKSLSLTRDNTELTYFLHTKSETPDLVPKKCDLFPYTPQSSHLLIFENSF